MTAFSATFDANALNDQLKQLARMDQFGAFSRALSRAGQSMRKQALVEVQSVLNLKAGPIRDVVNTRRVDRRDLAAELHITSRAVPIMEFRGTRATRRGLSVQVKKGGSRRVIRSGFRATMRSGKELALRRRFVTGGSQVRRLPLDTLFSTSVRQVLEDRSMQRRILDAGLARFRPELAREVQRRLAMG